MGRDVLVAGLDQGAVVKVVLAVDGERSPPSLRRVEAAGGVAVVQGEREAAREARGHLAHPGRGGEADLRAPAVGKGAPRNVKAIEIAGDLRRGGTSGHLRQLPRRGV